MKYVALFSSIILVCLAGSFSSETNAAERTRKGLQLLYDFTAASGPIVHDQSGTKPLVNLRIANVKAVKRANETIMVSGKTLIRSDQPATKLVDAARKTNEITIEAWLRPANTKQKGPARIVTLSKNSVERNFTLGQESGQFEIRLRTNRTSNNGIPAIRSTNGTAKTKLTHVVYTRARNEQATVYIDGKKNLTSKVAGNFANWDRGMKLALANEFTGDRQWQGTYALIALYSRALTAGEVKANFAAGPTTTPPVPLTKAERSGLLFKNHVAGIFARHCLECHDAVTKKGDLDLSQQTAAIKGGESGAAFVSGKSHESLLWKMIESNDMPKDRSPLSDAEKKRVLEWIGLGATWSLKTIDPAIYEAEVTATKQWIQRLTIDEYVETVRSSVGIDIEKEALDILPPDLRADGFNNTAYNLSVDLKHVEAYARLAEIIVQRMDVRAFADRFSKRRKFTDKDMGDLISKMGKWLLRGPLEEREVILYRGISTTVASAGGSHDEAVAFLVQAMLQSPRFIYRIETQRGDGSALPVNSYELASRLSYILWGAPPDENLMRAAENGGLDRSGVEAQVVRMLNDPRAVTRSSQFVEQWLDLDRLNNLQPNEEKFPDWSEQLAKDMRAETIAFFREVVWKQKRPLSELFNAQTAQLTPLMAKHYGLKPNGDDVATYDLSKVPGRGGLLTHASVLTVGGDEASMVARGLFVLRDVLRGTVKDPPPCVDTAPVATKAGLTQRSIAESRLANASCSGCHVKFEPLAFGLEKFDGIGAYHDADEHGNTLRDDGEILFPGTAKGVKYRTSAELMDILAKSERVRECITWKVTQFALGRPLVAADAPTIEKIHTEATKNGGTYQSLVNAIVLSDLVQLTRTEPDEVE